MEGFLSDKSEENQKMIVLYIKEKKITRRKIQTSFT